MLVLLLLACSGSDAGGWGGGGSRYASGTNFTLTDTSVDTGDTGDTGGFEEWCNPGGGAADRTATEGDDGGPTLGRIDAWTTSATVDGTVSVSGTDIIGGRLCLYLNGEDGVESYTSREIVDPSVYTDSYVQTPYDGGELTFTIPGALPQNYTVGAQVSDANSLRSAYDEITIEPA